MNDEEKNFSNLPEIIDIQIEDELDFELREPGEERGTIEAEIIHEETVEDEEKTKEEQEEKQEQEAHRDTSFSSFKANQKATEKRWRQGLWGNMRKIILVILALLIGIPLFGFGGIFGVAGVIMAIMFCGITLGLGVLGLGVSAFMMAAGMVAVGPVIFFMSLIGIGGGGLGLLLILSVFIWLKNFIVKGYKWTKIRRTKEVH